MWDVVDLGYSLWVEASEMSMSWTVIRFGLVVTEGRREKETDSEFVA
jgi:hypothetical protein